MKYLHGCIYIVVLFFFACANRVTPTGGEKDVTPPVLITADPPNYSTDMLQHRISLRFDEYIILKDPAQQVIVSPLINPMPELSVKKKTLEIVMPDSLKSNTTYTINFGTAITDVHEGNVFPFQYVFSTGPILDSLSISGKATDALTQTGKKGVKVMLYSSDDDSLPFKKKPDYFALTDSSGNFHINNISPGSYSLVASDDKNSNYINDNIQDEAISVKKRITLPDSSLFTLNYFTEQPKEVFIKSTSAAIPGRWDIVFNKSVIHPSVKSNSTELLSEWSAENDTLIVWSRDTIHDTLAVVINESGIPADTAIIKLKSRATVGGGRGGAAVAKNIFAESFTATTLIPGNDAVLKLMSPVSATDTSKIIFKEDSIRKSFSFSFADSLKRTLHIRYNWKEGVSYHLKILPGAFVDFAERKNDTLDYDFAGKKINETGSIAIGISGIESGNWLLQLLTKDFALLKEFRIDGPGKYEFNYVEPQQLKIRLINDENKNGKWDTGNYFQKREPEKTYYYNGDVQSRANWDVDIEWIVK
jgi:hypothetical protein